MKLFLSHSSLKSKQMADALTRWLPLVIDDIEPWSSNDIEKGKDWHRTLTANLQNINAGIIILDKDSLNSGWIPYEAGVLSKSSDRSYVCTLLLDIDINDVNEPLSIFQHTKCDKEDFRKMMRSINRALITVDTTPRSEKDLDKTFDSCWPVLEKEIINILPETHRHLLDNNEVDRIQIRIDDLESKWHASERDISAILHEFERLNATRDEKDKLIIKLFAMVKNNMSRRTGLLSDITELRRKGKDRGEGKD
jgi:hypothetical protein